MAAALVEAQACALGELELAMDTHDLKAQIPFNPGHPPPTWEPYEDPNPDGLAENLTEGAGFGLVIVAAAALWWTFGRDK